MFYYLKIKFHYLTSFQNNFSFLILNTFTTSKNIIFVTKTAVISVIIVPKVNVTANPFTGPVPKKNNTIAINNVV